jgi:HSP20 family molecular chaperone IbpA
MSSSRTIRSSKNSGTRSNNTQANSTSTNSQLSTASQQQEASLSTGFDNIFDQFRQSFDNLMAPFYPFSGVSTATPNQLLPIRSSIVDLIDEGDHYVVNAELPGFSKDQVDVQINKYGLLIRAEQKFDNTAGNGQQQGQQPRNVSPGATSQKGEATSTTYARKSYLHRERAYSAFERIIEFPEEIEPQKVEGAMKDGMLQLTIPKKEPAPEERLTKVQLK